MITIDQNKGIRVLSLFDGISCGRVALERAGIPVETYYASEIDKYAIQVAQKNYPDTIQIGDVCKIDFTQYIGKVDMIIGGSPCQDLSIAKQNRQGLQGERSRLFWEYIKALTIIKPKYFLLENVASMKNEDRDAITAVLRGIYPETECIMINSALVSAQQRKRYYWTNWHVEQPQDKGILLKDILTSGTTSRKKSKTIRSKGWNSGWGNKHEFDMPNEYRNYTLAELELLQNLPVGYTYGVSTSQARKLIGNGWTVDVIAHIFKQIPTEYNKDNK